MRTIKFHAYRILDKADEIEVEDNATQEDIQKALSNFFSRTKNADFDVVNEETVETDEGDHYTII